MNTSKAEGGENRSYERLSQSLRICYTCSDWLYVLSRAPGLTALQNKA